MAWRITKNLIDGPHLPLTRSRRDFREGEERFRFRLLDDDGEVYFEGESSDCTSHRAFAPLDSLGLGYGCTEIQYLTNGHWETL